MPVANNPTSYAPPGEGDDYQEDPYGGDPKMHAVKQLLEQGAQSIYGKTLGALTRDEFEPLLEQIKQSPDKIRDFIQKQVRGDGMSGDIGLSDIGGTRPAKFMKGLGEDMAGGFRKMEGFANREVPKAEQSLSNAAKAVLDLFSR